MVGGDYALMVKYERSLVIMAEYWKSFFFSLGY